MFSISDKHMLEVGGLILLSAHRTLWVLLCHGAGRDGQWQGQGAGLGQGAEAGQTWAQRGVSGH